MSVLNENQRVRLFKMREALDGFVSQIADVPQKVNQYTEVVRVWKPAVYAVGDVRREGNVPYKCVQAHDSTANESWTPSATPALWMQYHGTTPETARPWIAPAGAHDMYLAGEYMIWTDGNVYLCKQDTVYSPEAYPAGWETYTK